MNLKKLILSVILAFSLTACMGVKFSYNNLDWFVPWYLDDYLELSSDQEDAFDQHLNVIWDWHRKQELPQYTKLLNEIINDLDKQQLSLERLHYYGDKTGEFYGNIIIKALHEGKPFLKALDDEQLDELYDVIEENDQEFKEYVADNDLKKRKKKQYKSIKKTFKKWIGKLSKKQKARLKLWTTETESTLELRLAYVTKARKAFKLAMNDRAQVEKTNQRLISLATEPELLQSKQHIEMIERNNQRFRVLIMDILPTLSDKQNRRLRRKILNYAEDFTELSEE